MIYKLNKGKTHYHENGGAAYSWLISIFVF